MPGASSFMRPRRCQGANGFATPSSAGSSSGQWRRSTVRIVLASTQSMPLLGVDLRPVVAVKKRSLSRRRDAIRMKTRNAVSLKPNPSGFRSAYMPIIVSTRSTSP